MNHIVLILYILCAVADTVTIIVSGFIYRKFRYKALKYLSIVMSGALLSMLVEAARIYSRIVPVDMYFLKQVVYFVFDPVGKSCNFSCFLYWHLLFSVKKFPGNLKS